MATNYILPPWLTRQGVDPAEAFVSAFRAGASVAIEKAQLAEQSERAAMAAAIKEEENRRDALRADHKIAIEKAQSDALLGIRQSQLELQQQRAVETAKRAALTFQAQETYRRRVAGGEDPRKVLLEIGPGMGMTGSGMASLTKAPDEMFIPPPARDVMDEGGNPTGVQMFQTSPGGVTYRQKAPDLSQAPITREIPGTGKTQVQHGDRSSLVNTPKEPKNQLLVELEKALAKAKVDVMTGNDPTMAQAIPKLEAEIAKIKGGGSTNKPSGLTITGFRKTKE